MSICGKKTKKQIGSRAARVDHITKILYKQIMKDFNDDDYCFVCGSQNPYGLKLEFQYDEETDEIISKAVFPKHFQGWENVLHGGLISTVLDEIMVKAVAHLGLKCVTAELNVRFKKPAMLDKEFTAKAKITEKRKHLITARSGIVDSDNVTVASATGKFVVVE